MIDQTISNYRVTALIGQGGMGAVYEGIHEVLGRRVAIKFVHPQFARSEDVVSRFFNEARAAGVIQHPGIVEVYDVGRSADGLPYLIMEMLEGRTLGQTMRARRLELEEVIGVGCQIASTLGAAHAKGIVHRDLKPENLYLITRPDGSPGVKILDFGIAKLRDDVPHSKVVTNTGHILGTPLYMSPEQCRGVSREIDHRTDIYSLGILLYEALAGRPPFNAEGSGELIVQHLQEPPPPLPMVPPAVEAVIMRALAKHPDDRHETMEEFEAALAESIGHGSQTAPRGRSAATWQRPAAPTAWRTTPPASNRAARGSSTTLSGAATGQPGTAGARRSRRRVWAAAAVLSLAGLGAGAFYRLGGQLPSAMRGGLPAQVSAADGPKAPATLPQNVKPQNAKPENVKIEREAPARTAPATATVKPSNETPPPIGEPAPSAAPDVVPAAGLAAQVAGLRKTGTPAPPRLTKKPAVSDAARKRRAAMEAW